MNFFFVSGAHKSGTSWLASMLRAHPEIAMPENEMWFFGHEQSLAGEKFRLAIERWLELPTVGEEFGPSNRLFARVAKVAVSTILRKYAGPSTKALGDKTPLFYLKGSNELLEVFPEARLIVIYRDGRDVVVSYHFHNLRLRDFRKYQTEAEGEAAYRYHIERTGEPVPLIHNPTLVEACRTWVRCNNYAESARNAFGERFLMTSYEELWTDPVPFLSLVFSSLGVRADRMIVESIARSKSFLSVTRERALGTMDPKSFYRKGEPGDWRNYFDAQSAAWFNEIGGEWLLKLHYASSLDWCHQGGA